MKKEGGRRALRVGALLVLLSVMLWIGYVNDYYCADERAETYMKDGNGVTVGRIKNGWFFDGPGETDALVLYPGAKVESEAYAPLMHCLAERGVDCFLVEMPCHFAFLGEKRIEALMKNYSYDKWYLTGHSLGGAIAAIYASKHSDRLGGLVLLGAYSTKNLAYDGFRVLSIDGSEDLVQNWKKAEKGRKYMPEDYTEILIQGGNHAQFGSYGKQKGDGDAAISPQEQQEQTADAILRFIAGDVF